MDQRGIQDLLKALTPGGYNAAPSTLSGQPLVIEDIIFICEEAIRGVAKSLGARCKCDIRDLMTFGHSKACPERKK